MKKAVFENFLLLYWHKKANLYKFLQWKREPVSKKCFKSLVLKQKLIFFEINNGFGSLRGANRG